MRKFYQLLGLGGVGAVVGASAIEAAGFTGAGAIGTAGPGVGASAIAAGAAGGSLL